MAGRNLGIVIQQILGVIPPDQYSVRSRVQDVADSIAYTAPEIQIELWRRLCFILNDELGDPKEALWKQSVADIVNDSRSASDVT